MYRDNSGCHGKILPVSGNLGMPEAVSIARTLGGRICGRIEIVLFEAVGRSLAQWHHRS